MLAADALTLQGELAGARELLMQATENELGTRDGADILGRAALRALSPGEALKLTENAEETPAVSYTRATAVLEKTGSCAAERARAIAGLDELVTNDDRQVAPEAALARLAVTMVASTEWSERAEALLTDSGNQRPALMLRAFYVGSRHSDWEGAYALFDHLGDRPWVPAARLMVALAWGRNSVMKEAADAVMLTGPSQMVRLSCGRAYFRVGEFTRAREALMVVVRDDNAPGLMRADAYKQLVRIAILHDDWELADRLHGDWLKVRPGDTRAQTLAPTIANRLAQQRRQRES